jgi:hypothetical protein
MDRRHLVEPFLKMAGLERPEQSRARDVVPGREPEARKARGKLRAKLQQGCPAPKLAGVMTQSRREGLKSSQFAVPAKKALKLGVEGEIQGHAKGKYPIPDLSHARNALTRVSQFGTSGERAAVRKKVYSKYPQLREGFEERHGESPMSKRNLQKTKVAEFINKLAGTVVMRQLTPAQKAYMDRLTGNTQGQSISRNRSNRQLDYHLNKAPNAPGLTTELHAPGAGIATAEDIATKARARQHYDQTLQRLGKTTNTGTGYAAPAPAAPAQASTVAGTPRSIAAQGGQGTVASTPRALARNRPAPARAATQVTRAATPLTMGTANTQVAKVTSPAAFARTKIGPAPHLPRPGRVVPLRPKLKGGLLRGVGKKLKGGLLHDAGKLLKRAV